MKRKFIEIEVDTTMTNKQLKEKTLWKWLNVNPECLKVIQIKVNAVRDWKRKG